MAKVTLLIIILLLLLFSGIWALVIRPKANSDDDNNTPDDNSGNTKKPEPKPNPPDPNPEIYLPVITNQPLNPEGQSIKIEEPNHPLNGLEIIFPPITTPETILISIKYAENDPELPDPPENE